MLKPNSTRDPFLPKGPHNTCANCWNDTTSISSKRLLLIRSDRSKLISMEECRHFAKPTPTWPASCTSTTPRRLGNKIDPNNEGVETLGETTRAVWQRSCARRGSVLEG